MAAGPIGWGMSQTPTHHAPTPRPALLLAPPTGATGSVTPPTAAPASLATAIAPRTAAGPVAAEELLVEVEVEMGRRCKELERSPMRVAVTRLIMGANNSDWWIQVNSMEDGRHDELAATY